MKKIKGVMVSPQVVEGALYSFDEVDEYRVIVRTSADKADIAAIQIMTKEGMPDPEAFLSRVIEKLRTPVGIRFDAELSGDLPPVASTRPAAGRTKGRTRDGFR